MWRKTKAPTQELKWFDRALAGHIFGASTGVNLVRLNDVPAGLDATARVGRKIYMTRLQLNGHLQRLWSTSNDAHNEDIWLRFNIVYDKQPNGVTPTAAQLFSQPTSPATSFTNLDNRDRFIWLAEKNVQMSPVRTIQNDIQTFWTRTSQVTHDSEIHTFPNVGACVYNLTAGASVGAPVIPTSFNPTASFISPAIFQIRALAEKVQDMGDPGVDPNATHNTVRTYWYGPKMAKRIQFDLDLYLESEFGDTIVETGALYLVYSVNPEFVAPAQPAQFLWQWTSRLRFTD